MIQGVIIALDGTLLDNRGAHALAWKKTLDEVGLRASLTEIERVMGCDPNQLLAQLAGVEAGSIRGQNLLARKAKIFESEFIQRIRPFPFSKELLARLRESGLRYTMLSTAHPCELKSFFNLLNCPDLLDFSQQTELLSPSLTNPVEAAVGRLRLNPLQIIMIGNTPFDIEAALSHGIQTIVFRSGGWTDQDLSGARAIYNDIPDLLRQFDQSPLAQEVSSRSVPTAA